uniref:Cytochrome c oxidase subunit 3 n=1 Tax=Fulvia mutica TaxID=80828 RepID=T2HIK9_FULMU|nr:cytochrome c oxidase subunit III [Fulvia mutica]BAN79055.1 cytochrome c oxidase subunit 3 [Fulvia mutica]
MRSLAFSFGLSGYPVLNASKWPIFMSMWAVWTVSSLVLFMHSLLPGWSVFMSLGGVTSMGIVMRNWFSDVIFEGRRGYHTRLVVRGMKMGMGLFILSEGAFFLSFFWAFLHACWGNLSMNLSFPPKGIKCLNPWGIPLLNSFLLVGSGLTVTYAHKAVKSNKFKWSEKNPELELSLGLTVFLGFTFLLLQMYEYWWMSFSMNDGVYGSCFYIMTGFHGLHVVAGTVWLAVCLGRAMLGHFQVRYRHVGLQFAIWYWHFVDVVWLGLYFVVYLNGSIWY